MNPVLVYDTETTGLPLFSEPAEHPDQPHIVQLAAILVDTDTEQDIASMNVIVRPNGWTLPDDVAKVHGITQDHAMAVGIPEELALYMFMELWMGRLRIAHNESFDARIIRIALKRHHDPREESLATPPSDVWKASTAECTARMSTPILNLPPTEKMIAAGRRHAKTPNLGEAYQHFAGKPLQNAHNAMADVQACMFIYFAMRKATKIAEAA